MERVMTSQRYLAIAIPILAACLAAAPAARAQQFAPTIAYVYPAGGRQGETFQVKVGGQLLNGAGDAHVSGPGAQAKVVEHIKPMTQKDFNDLREQMQELVKQRKTAELLRQIDDIRKKLSTFNRNANPAMADTVILEVTIAADAPPGRRELRLTTNLGVTNPLVFCVGQLPECREQETTNPNAYPGASAYGRLPGLARTERETAVTLPTVINGQIMPGDVDRYRFRAVKGQHLVVAASARELIPYLADAVPGWFQATLALYDAKGNEVAYVDDYRFHPDPVLVYEAPADGDYVLEIRDAIYRGREDFVYRIAVGELPFVTSIFPLGGPAGTDTVVELAGWNLPTERLTLNQREPGVQMLAVEGALGVSNAQPFAVDTLPECLEKEPNGGPPDAPAATQDAQAVTLPVIVNGRIGEPGDCDVFRFDGRAGDEIVAEVLARRLDSPLDSVLLVTDAKGQPLAFNDDHEDKGAGLETHHADSYVRATLPADGACYVHLGDAQRKGGPAYAYRLRIGPPQPDFELRVAPSSLNIRGGGTVALAVYALRRDGFAGPIDLALVDTPAGFTLSGGRLPADQDQVRITLTAPAKSSKDPYHVHLEGRAQIGGRDVVRQAVPAEDLMQAFAYRHLVPAAELQVAVSGRGASRASVRILGDLPLKIPAGGTARLRVGIPADTAFGKIDLELSEPPDGIALRDVSSDRSSTEIVLAGDADKIKPGLRGNLIVNAFITPKPRASDSKPANPRRMPIGALPAIPFEIVEPRGR